MRGPVVCLKNILLDVFSGFGQIMLQRSAFVGAVFFAGALINSYMLALFGLVGCLAGVMTAMSGRYPGQDRCEGLYGFNGALVGLGIGYFYDTSVPLLVLVILGGMVSSKIMCVLMHYNIRPLTFPFVLVTWFIMVALSVSGLASPSAWSEAGPTTINLMEGISRGYGQVLFQEHVTTGLLFTAIITIKNWTQGLFAMTGAVSGLMIGHAMGFSIDAINLGLFGYNGVLCGILFAGRGGKNIISAAAAILLSVAFVRLAQVTEIPALTMPFVGASWLTLWGQRKIWKLDSS